MSTMRWTFKSNIKGIALKNGLKSKVEFKKGDTIPIQVYEYYFDSRGGGSSTATQYYFGSVPTNKKPQYQPPQTQELFLDEDFEFEKSTGESSTPIKMDGGTGVWHKLKNNKLLIYGLIAVAGYFAYKKFKK